MIMPNPIEQCDEAISLIEQGVASQADVMQAMALKQKLFAIYQAVSYRFERAAIAFIEANGEIEEGAKRYYVGKDTVCKCKHVPNAWRAIIAACGGDEDLALTALSSDCFKPSLARKMLGEDATQHFDINVQSDLKTGEPRKKLKGARLPAPGQATDELEEAA